MDDFEREVAARVRANADDRALRDAADAFLRASIASRYSYNFSWLGRPVIQYPQDLVAVQELVWQVRPDLIIETGIARGGSLVFSASLLALLDLADAVVRGDTLDPRRPTRRVLGIDIDIRPHNRAALEKHPFLPWMRMIEGSSVAPDVVAEVRRAAAEVERVMVLLDSNHTHTHVLAELEAYAPLVRVGGYCVVFDTVIAEMPDGAYPDRPWGPGNNPATAVEAFLARHPEFENDDSIHHKLAITVARNGYLKRVGP